MPPLILLLQSAEEIRATGELVSQMGGVKNLFGAGLVFTLICVGGAVGTIALLLRYFTGALAKQAESVSSLADTMRKGQEQRAAEGATTSANQTEIVRLLGEIKTGADTHHESMHGRFNELGDKVEQVARTRAA